MRIPNHWNPRTLLGCGLTTLLVACGGGGGGGNNLATNNPPPATTSDFDRGVFQASSNFVALCEAPRAGNFPDGQGSTLDENNWLRSWSHELYLWYDEIVDEDPASYSTPAYFDLMKTFELNTSGEPKDTEHFTMPTDEWQALSQGGVDAGYGAEITVLAGAPPREIVVTFSEPNSPAALAGITRGARIVEVDGVDVEFGADVDTLNAGLFPATAGETHEFVVRDLGAATTRTVSLTSATVAIDPVRFERVFDTPTGPVGYLFFSIHNEPAEAELVAAMADFAAQGVTDLVLDVRYNRGGLLDLANQLSYMIAGPAAASGRTFAQVQFSDQHPDTDPVTGQPLSPDVFIETTVGFSAPAGDPLPTLNLNRLYVLSTSGTCSASEAIINGLRGIGVEVVLIGGNTCGKPYGFYPTDNCGTTYFSIQLRIANAVGFGDYPQGFSPQNIDPQRGELIPGCAVADDLNNVLGDPAEALLATALAHRETGSCTAVSSLTLGLAKTPEVELESSVEPSAGQLLVAPRRFEGAVRTR